MIIDFNRYNGGGGSGTELSPVTEFPLEAEAGTVVAYNGTASASGVYQYTGEEWVPVGVDDLSAYWTSAQTQSAITIVEDHLFDVEQVTASALTELHEGLMEVSGRSVSTEEIELPIAAAVNELKGNIEARLDQQYYKKKEVNDIAARKMEVTQVDAQIKDYVDPVIAEVNDTIVDKELPVSAALNNLNEDIATIDEVIPAALVDLNDRIVELSGSSVDLSAYYTSAQTQDAISAATSGKADASNVQTYGDYRYFPKWNEQGIITDTIGSTVFESSFEINNEMPSITVLRAGWNRPLPHIYAPTTSGNPGEILVSTGNGAPVWTTDNKVSSASVSTIWKGTQAEYDAITTKDASTLYIIL